jgi:iron complex outermembrane receptor protein
MHLGTLVINGTPGGSVGTDLNVIPPAAIKRIEVLRDGAASVQLNAIAINVQLRTYHGRKREQHHQPDHRATAS